jgi:hypothetical protein
MLGTRMPHLDLRIGSNTFGQKHAGGIQQRLLGGANQTLINVSVEYPRLTAMRHDRKSYTHELISKWNYIL